MAALNSECGDFLEITGGNRCRVSNTEVGGPMRLKIKALFFGIGIVMLISCGKSPTSPGDTVKWTSDTLSNTKLFNSIAYGSNRFVVVGDYGTIISSSDGKAWSQQTIWNAAPFAGLNSVTYADNMFVAVGDSGRIFTSIDGIHWLDRSAAVNTNLVDVAWNGSMFVTVGWNGIMLSSPDAVTWTNRTPALLQASVYINFRTVAGGNNMFVVGGDSGYSEQPIMLTSTNGINWEIMPDTSMISICKIRWINNQFIAGTAVGIFTSPDGLIWSDRIKKAGMVIYGIAWSGNQYIAIGYPVTFLGSGPSICYSSSDGMKWQLQQSPPGFPIDITYAMNKFVAVGITNLDANEGVILTYP